MKQHSDSAGGEARTSNLQIVSLALYQLSHYVLYFQIQSCAQDFRECPVQVSKIWSLKLDTGAHLIRR